MHSSLLLEEKNKTEAIYGLIPEYDGYKAHIVTHRSIGLLSLFVNYVMSHHSTYGFHLLQFYLTSHLVSPSTHTIYTHSTHYPINLAMLFLLAALCLYLLTSFHLTPFLPYYSPQCCDTLSMLVIVSFGLSSIVVPRKPTLWASIAGYKGLLPNISQSFDVTTLSFSSCSDWS